MRIHQVRLQCRNGSGELSARVRPEGSPAVEETVWFRFPSRSATLDNAGDVFLCAFLIPCMQAGENLRIDAPVSQGLMSHISRIQDIFLKWHPSFHRSRVRAGHSDGPCRKGEGVVACFSGGVDSLFTMLKMGKQVDRLLLVHGFENPVESEDLLSTTLSVVRPLTERFRLPLVVATTNLRSLADRQFARWGKAFPGTFFGSCWMGSFLAAMGHCLRPECGRLVIPASLHMDELVPYGSHPDLDPLWSSEALECVHHGAETGRLDKIRYVARVFPEAASCLQVCESNPPGEINCGRCDKCLRTILAFRVNGAIPTAPVFPRQPEWARWPLVADAARWGREYAALAALSKKAGENEAAASLEKILNPPPFWRDLHRRCRTLAKSILWRFLPGLVPMLKGGRHRRW